MLGCNIVRIHDYWNKISNVQHLFDTHYSGLFQYFNMILFL